MAVKAATRVSIFDRLGGQPVKTQVCTYWLAGRCNRNPCRFMHRESPPPQSRETKLAPPKDVRGMQSRKMTWRSPNYNNPETATLSSNKACTAVAVVRAAIRSSQKAKPKQCKYWITGNCVHGDKCKDLHSWFSGSGFTLLKKLEGHTKVSLIHKYFDTIFLRLLLGFPSHLALTSYIHVARINPFELGCHTGQCAGSVITDGEAGCLISEGSWLLVGLQTALKAWNLQHHAEFGLVYLLDGSILVWKLNLETLTLEAAEMLKGHHGVVTSLVVGSNSKLYSGSRDCSIRVWDWQNLQCLHTLYRHTKDVMAVICWDNYLLSASLDNTRKIWAATESGTIDVIHEIKEDCGFIALCGIHDAEVKPILLCSCNDNTVPPL
ncbi:UNVERIFIED_CONTAM: Zinc finger CCCH domain-containing protein 17 [Sesamum latifolium]|uniref:Zinc finger CCCH domain-containing protein 17 n=1 Tax=Sesamum latifolium TaxID=2727402 RepID=A0AAW2XMV1_9LAMI